MEEFPTCYIEEEFPEELLHMASQDAAIATSHNSSRVMGSDTDQEKQVEEQGQDAAREQQSKEATSEAAKTKPGGPSKEGGKILVPPPISTMEEQWHVPPPFFHPKNLELMFELRSQMEDQVHCGTLTSQRIDMLYGTFSNTPVGQKFPTCARPYVPPARDGLQDEDVDMATSEANG